MSLPGVKATNLPLATLADSLIVVRGGNARQMEPAHLSAQLGAINGPTYETRALLYADLAWPAGSVGKVVGDATLAYRGIYKKSGGSGSGSWTRIGPLPEADAEGLASEMAAGRQGQDTLVANLLAKDAAIAQLNLAARGRAINLFPNGNLAADGAALIWFDSLLSTSTNLRTTLVTATNTVLTALGITRALDIPANAETVGLQGNALCADVRLQGGSLYASVLVETVTGGWDFGGATPPRVTLRYTDGTQNATFMNNYEDLGGNVRRYYGTVALSAGKTAIRVELGALFGRPRADAFRASGFWASHLFTAAPTIADTAFPNWVQAAYRYPVTLDTRVKALERVSSLQALRAALNDDFVSVLIVILADSKGWGTGASGTSASTPRNHSLDDPRNTIDAAVSPTWVNLLFRWMALTYCSGTITAGAPGVMFVRKWVIGDICNDNARFRVRDRRTGGVRPKSVTQRPSGPLLLRNLDLPAVGANDDALEFEFTGDEFKVVFAKLNFDAGATFTVEIDGVVVGSTYAHGGGNAFGFEELITTTFGKHRVRIWNNSTTQALRLEAIKHHRKLQIRNQGIIGTASHQWVPGQPLFDNGVYPEDTFAFIQLGTNDRPTTALPNLRINAAQRVRDNLGLSGSALLASGIQVILMTPTRATDDYPGNPLYAWDTQDLAMAIRQAAGDLGVSCIDNFAMSTFDPAGGYLSDGLHDNDSGHRGTFRNIVTSLGLVGLPLL